MSYIILFPSWFSVYGLNLLLGHDMHSTSWIQDPKFWTYRPLSEMMVRAAVDDVRFLPYIHHKIMEKLNEQLLCQLAVRGALYCRCFCVSDKGFADWPPIPTIPGPPNPL